MTLTEAVQQVLSATKAGRLEDADEALAQLQTMLNGTDTLENIPSALDSLQEARRAIHAHRAHIVDHLLQLDRSALYSHEHSLHPATWEFSG
jgi:hypothetical protein